MRSQNDHEILGLGIWKNAVTRQEIGQEGKVRSLGLNMLINSEFHACGVSHWCCCGLWPFVYRVWPGPCDS